MKTFAEHMAHAEREYLSAVLNEAKGNIARAAEIAGTHRSTIYARIRKQFGVQMPARGRRGNAAWLSLRQ